MQRITPSSSLVHQRSLNELDTIIPIARDLNRLTQERRRLPGMSEYMEQIWRSALGKPQEIDAFRQLRQTFLSHVGKLLDAVTQYRTLPYPRNFLTEIVKGFQALKGDFFSEEMVSSMSQTYRPWSEDFLHGCEIGVNFSQSFQSIATEIVQIDPQQKAKLEKASALLKAFDNLRIFAEDAQEFDKKFEDVLLEFDRAWWEYLYLAYHPMSKEDLESRMKDHSQSMIAFIDSLQKEPRLEEEIDDGIESFSELLDEYSISEMPPLLKKVEESIQASHVEEIEKLVLQTVSSLVPPVQIPETVITSILSQIEKPVDYSEYRGKKIEFIRDHFEIAFQSPEILDLSDTTEFYITDIHTSYGHRALYTAFVNLFSTAKTVVAIEDERGPHKARKSFHSLWMKTPVHITGWDEKSKETLEDRKFRRLILSYICLIGDIINPDYSGDKRKRLKTLLEVLASPERKAKFEEFQKRMDAVELEVLETFQERNRSMIQTVKEEAPLADSLIVIAGGAHLLRANQVKGLQSLLSEKAKSYYDDPRLDVEEVHAFLKTRKAVILVPKEEKVIKAARPYNNFLLLASIEMHDAKIS